MVDPERNMFIEGSGVISIKSADCEWGTTSVYFGITYVCFVPRILNVFATIRIIFYLPKNIIWRTQTKYSKSSCRLITWMGFVWQILIKLETYLIRGFLQLPLWCPLGNNLSKHTGSHLVTTERTPHLWWPLSDDAHGHRKRPVYDEVQFRRVIVKPFKREHTHTFTFYVIPPH